MPSFLCRGEGCLEPSTLPDPGRGAAHLIFGRSSFSFLILLFINTCYSRSQAWAFWPAVPMQHTSSELSLVSVSGLFQRKVIQLNGLTGCEIIWAHYLSLKFPCLWSTSYPAQLFNLNHSDASPRTDCPVPHSAGDLAASLTRKIPQIPEQHSAHLFPHSCFPYQFPLSKDLALLFLTWALQLYFPDPLGTPSHQFPSPLPDFYLTFSNRAFQ